MNLPSAPIADATRPAAAQSAGASPAPDAAATDFAALLGLASLAAPAEGAALAALAPAATGTTPEDAPAEEGEAAAAPVDGAPPAAATPLLLLAGLVAADPRAAPSPGPAASLAPAEADAETAAASASALLLARPLGAAAAALPGAGATPSDRLLAPAASGTPGSAMPSPVDAGAMQPPAVAAAFERAFAAVRESPAAEPAPLPAPAATAASAGHALHAASATPAPVALAPVVVAVETPAFVAGWHEETAATVAGVVLRGHERAELRITPPDLGPVEVRIDLSTRGEASVAIVAAQAATRDALEQALPLLRDLLAQQGLALGEASVRDGQAEARDTRGGRDGREAAARGATADAPPEAVAVPVRHRTRLVDTFA